MEVTGIHRRRQFPAAPLLPVLLIGLILLITGCQGGYALEGRVIRGDYSHIQFVSADDARLVEGPGIDGASVLVFRDPGSLGRKLASRSNSGPQGSFVCALGEFGAGWLVEDWEITVMRPGFANASRTGQIPRGSQDLRMLVFLAEGASTPVPTRDQMIGDIDRFGGR